MFLLQVMVMFAVMTRPTLTYGNLNDSNWLAAVMLCFSVMEFLQVVLIAACANNGDVELGFILYRSKLLDLPVLLLHLQVLRMDSSCSQIMDWYEILYRPCFFENSVTESWAASSTSFSTHTEAAQ